MTKAIDNAPTEFQDWTIDWSKRGLGTDTIATSVWSKTGGGTDYTISNTSFTNTTTTMWLTGGTLGVVYQITNTITTAGGRTMRETVNFTCEEKEI